MITAPTAPSEFGTSVDDLAAAYSPQELQKRYKVTKELVYLLALQKVKSEMDAAQRSLAMSQQQVPGTVKQQLESQVMQGKMQEASGVMSQMPQMMQRQPQMAAQGGIVGYQGGGMKEDEEDKSLIGDAFSNIYQWVQDNPEEAVAAGLLFVPGVGVLGNLLGRGAMAAYRAAQAIDYVGKGKKAAQAVGSAAKRAVTKPDPGKFRQGTRPFDPKIDRSISPNRIAGYGAVTGSGVIASTGDDDEEAGGSQVRPPLQGPPLPPKKDEEKEDPTKPAEIKMRPATDFQGIAQDQALRVKSLSPALVGSLEAQAAMTPEQMTERRDAEAQRYLDKIGAEERTQGLQDLYDEQLAVLETQADPEELRRRRRMAFFSNIGTGGIGSILRGGSRGLIEEEDAQRKEARDAAQTRITGYKSVHEFDLSMIKDAEDKGLAILQLDRLDKRNAQTALSNITRSDLASINSYADRLRASEDSRIQEQFQKLELLQNNYESLRKDERLDYSAALALYGEITNAEAAVYAAEVAKLPDDVRVLMLQAAEGAELSAKEQERVLKAQQVIDAAINAALNKMGVLNTKDAIIKRIEAGFAGTRKAPISPQQILGVGT